MQDGAIGLFNKVLFQQNSAGEHLSTFCTRSAQLPRPCCRPACLPRCTVLYCSSSQPRQSKSAWAPPPSSPTTCPPNSLPPALPPLPPWPAVQPTVREAPSTSPQMLVSPTRRSKQTPPPAGGQWAWASPPQASTSMAAPSTWVLPARCCLPAGCWGVPLGAGALAGALARTLTALSTWVPPAGCWSVGLGA